MLLPVLTGVVIALLIAVLAIFLFAIGSLLNRTANNLADCAQNVKNISYQAEVIGPGIERINTTGTTVIGALPLLVEGAEKVGEAKGAPYVDPDAPRRMPYSAPAPAPAAAPVYRAAPVSTVTTEESRTIPSVPTTHSQSVGYLDDDTGKLGYMDS